MLVMATLPPMCHVARASSSSAWLAPIELEEGAHRNDPGARAHRADVQHENLIFAQLLHFALLLSRLQVGAMLSIRTSCLVPLPSIAGTTSKDADRTRARAHT